MFKLKMNHHRNMQITSLVRKGIATLTLASFFTCSLFTGTGETLKSAYGADISTASFTRFAGEGRYETAVEISSNNWKDGTGSVVLTRGDEYPDALAGAVLANSAVAGGGPLLLTEPNRLRPEVLTEIQRLKATSVFILGGTGAISASVENALKANGLTTYRIQGNDRYETAANIAATSVESSTRAFLASGKAFADALSISSYAAAHGIPLLLTDTQKVPAATLNALQKLGVTEITLIGGESAVSASVAGQLKTAGYTVSRLSGPDRYKTNVAILEGLSFNMDKMITATGSSFPDALAGSVLAARNNNPILLVPKSEKDLQANTSTLSYLATNRANVNNFFFLGGFDVISTAVQNIVRVGNTSSKISLQFWTGYGVKSEYERLLTYVPDNFADYIDILVPNFAGGLQDNGSFAYRFSTAETPMYLVSLGHSKNVQVLPLVMVDGELGNNMLSDPAKRNNFVTSAVKMIQETNADGIDVDFEILDDSLEEEVTGLLSQLYSTLHPQGKMVIASVMSKTSDAQTWYAEFNYHDMAQYADYLQIMSYDYSTSNPGPIAPVDWVRKVMSYAVTKVPSEKILMGIPYYGRDWRVNNTGDGWVISQTFGWTVAKKTAAEVGATITRANTLTDPIGVPTFTYVDENNRKHSCYFDDRLSWGVKLDLVNEFDLGGIAGWSMGWVNDVSAPELYPLLKERIN
ncbi:cell wall-binding repeat-containing protein [Dehalobacter sp.]|uniref:cell wall-binding repeat-containing protein n=1 Tax=Dehalobacter sp. TaxID=1962289 RepID=UPI00258D2154|nr:cell wall-binding repeat-containing protein [Dehalobacter sp.]MCG1024848.1 cell wall-binding repeat-containing protein [Dehalobacter sp.]